MDYKHAAQQVLDAIGGASNIVSAAHCATRLRLVIADNDKVDKKALENAEGAKGVFEAQGQLQIIFGTGTVNKVYDEFTALAGIGAATKEEVKQAAAAKAPWYQQAIKTLGDIFVPIIPAIVASGFLMGIMEALNFMVNNGFVNIDTSGSLYVFAQLFSNTAYTFLPILIAFSAAKVFGGNPFLGAVIGMIMIHPNLQNAWTVASEGVQTYQPVFGGLYSIPLVGYQGHVIPVIIAVWLMSQIEKRLHKVVPAMFDLFVTPLVSVFVTGYLTLAVIGPIFTTVEDGIINGVQALIQLPYGIGSFVMGGLYAITVVAGIHHMYTLIDVGQLAEVRLHLLAAPGQRCQRGPGRCRSGRRPQEQERQGQVHGSALRIVCLHGHHRARHLRRQPALLQALYRRPGGRCLRRAVRQHRGPGCHRHRRDRHLRYPAAPAYAAAVHHRHAHCFRCRIRCDLGDLEAGRRKRIKTAKGHPQGGFAGRR